jgi:hypothetical protein
LFTDHKPAPINYYQLSQLDNNNTLQYSDIRVVNFNAQLPVLVYPNPSNGEINIVSQNEVNFQITDITGRIIVSDKTSNNSYSAQLNKGIYFIKITDEYKTYSNKIIIQ